MTVVLRLMLAWVFLSVAAQPVVAVETDAPWWLSPHRLLQTNLREIDATMDLDRYMTEVQEFGADVVLFNVGGIVANYPTELEFHYRNPNMQGDLVGTVLRRLHEHDLRMIGRFDFSKINEQFAARHPEWLYVSETGENVNYNGQVHTCVSGGYQQEYMLKILGEALDRYPLDGVFFNMIGYQRRDYSGNEHGICQCNACKRLFKDYSGLDLPATQSNSDTYRKYAEFTNMMRDRQFTRVNEFLKGKRPDLCICTYTSTGVDVIRKESNRALGQGTYHDTDKAKWTMLTCGQRQLANAAVHFIRIPHRHAAVAPSLTGRRLWQQMVNGAWLDFYCIGPLQRQEDRMGLDVAAGIYQFHRANERWLTATAPAGQVGLVRRGDDEYEGLLSVLSENQIAFELTRIEPQQLKRFSIVVVPDAGGLNSEDVAALDHYVRTGGRVLLTGQVPEGFRSLGKVDLVETHNWDQGAYVRIRPEDRAVLDPPILEKLDLVFLRGDFHVCQAAKATKLLRLIPPDMFGPPEKCYYRHVSDHPALLYHRHGGRGGAAACFCFHIGKHYQMQAHQGHAALVVGAIDALLDGKRRVKLNGPALVEINHRADTAGAFEWVSLWNHTGQRGNALHDPVPIREMELTFTPEQPVKSVRLLKTGVVYPSTQRTDKPLTIPLGIEDYEIVVFEYE